MISKKSTFAAIFCLLMVSYCLIPWYVHHSPPKFSQLRSDWIESRHIGSFSKTLPKLLSQHIYDYKSGSSFSPANYYCNFPQSDNFSFGDEGKASSHWKLKQVHVIIRHGDRTPLFFDLYKQHHVKPDFCSSISKDSTLDTLLSKHLIDRIIQMQKSFSSIFSNENCHPAQHTKLGTLQHLHNGFKLRKRYFQLFKFSSVDNAFKKIQVFSTRSSRTIASAISFTFGFLPDLQADQFSMKFVDNVYFCTKNCVCLKANQVYEKLVKKRKLKLYKERQIHNETIKHIASSMKISDRTGAQMDKLVNGFLCKGLKLPCSSSNNCITTKDLDIVMNEQENMVKVLREESPLRNQSLLNLQPLLAMISASMVKVLKSDPSAKKFFLYSGHDTTLRPLLAALDIKDYREHLDFGRKIGKSEMDLK